ncbi:peptide/nickel transport system substrate-binding protein [Agromyces terreus]|uniref:Peptide/nickel transport system substrate-binding protein n=1 Tax=Agromyces terreus TaxID=424795 RepID=A0A9X2GZN5_9MICO|nr:ABC transporter substrate-binding protein [Agromyces terreus]MCP2370456.1 peptide/nickel transport system substrate-binding protein [Agromyces terreus]
MRKSILATGAILVAAGLAFTGCSASTGGDDGGTSTKVLTVGMPNGPQQPNQNPLATGSASLSLGYAFVVYESLMQINEIDPTEAPTPWLAESVEWNPEYTQATITPREGVKWSDGEDFTADDIAFSIQLRKDNPELNVDFPDQYGDITVEDGKVVVNFTTGQYVNEVKLYKLLIVPKHIWEGEDAVTFSDDEMIGTGPFTLKSFSPQAVTLTPNDDYWGGKSKVGELRYDAYNDNAGLTTALTTGEAQWGWTFIPDYESTYIDKDPEHFNQVAGGGFGVDVLYLNNETKPFDNVAFRQALNMVIDHADITATAGYGVWPEITSVTGLPQPSGDAFISSEYEGQNLEVDVDGAKKVLTDAGYTYDGDKLIDPDGEAVSFKLTNPSGWTDYLDALGIIAEGAASLGAEATVDAIVQDTWFNDTIPFGNFQASLHWTDGGSTPWNLYSNIMDGASYVPLGETANWNFGRYQNDDVTKALADFKSGTDPDARQASLDIVQQHYVEDVPGIVIWSRPAVAQYSTQNYTGFPTSEDPYANPQPTGPQAALILSKLTPSE